MVRIEGVQGGGILGGNIYCLLIEQWAVAVAGSFCDDQTTRRERSRRRRARGRGVKALALALALATVSD